MTHPDTLYWRALAEAVRAAPSAPYNIVDWKGNARNVKQDVLSVYNHLARCPNAHSILAQRVGRPMCQEDIK